MALLQPLAVSLGEVRLEGATIELLTLDRTTQVITVVSQLSVSQN